MGGFGTGIIGSMYAEENNISDIASTREYYNKSEKWYMDWDYQAHDIQPPSGTSDTQFITTLHNQALNYERNTAVDPISYHLMFQNCCTWTNSMFQFAGIDQSTRVKAGDFLGWDQAAGNSLPNSYFNKICK